MGHDGAADKRQGRLLRWAGMLAIGAVMSGVMVLGGTGVASAANSGTATCADQSTVVGVWVTVSGGTSGWATRSGSGFEQSWRYNTQGKSYKLTVGCGGTPARWASSTSTPTFSTTWSNVMCFPGWGYGLGTIYVKDRCYRA